MEGCGGAVFTQPYHAFHDTREKTMMDELSAPTGIIHDYYREAA